MKKVLKHLRKNWIRYGFETLVVIVGVLIAFTLSDWNEERKSRKLQKQYLTRLIQDLNQDLFDLESVIRAADIITVLSVDALAKLGADTAIVRNNERYVSAFANVTIDKDQVVHKYSSMPINIKTFGNQLSLMTQQRYFDLTLATYNDLMSNGNIEVIENQELRNKIQSHYGEMIGHLDFQEHAVRPFSEDYLTVLKEYGIIPMSKITLQDIEKIIEEDHKILTAIYYLLQSNLDFVGMSYSNDNSFQNRILEIKLQIETTLNHL